MKLVWNAIVKNEAAIIERCVNSLLSHVDGAVIVDTGSTDGTTGLIMSKFVAAEKPVEIGHISFENFAQARNVALRTARESHMAWDYLLLADADMELRVHKPDWINGARGLSYDMRQTAGSVGYFNRRLVRRDAPGQYTGVTHEYLDVESAGILDGAEFIDHADGANRPEKFQRDIALLVEALKTETNPGLIERYTFYLAQTHFDLGQWDKAAVQYKKRTELGGYEEERWNAQLHYAHCLDNMGDKPGFLWEMLQAYRMRPHRAEVLYDLAKYYRERGDNHTSLLFSEAGMQVPHPKQDLLFVNDWVYSHGLKEEFSICGYYDKSRRTQAGKVCDELVLDGSEQARFNQYWYLKPLVYYVPSWRPTRLHLAAPSPFSSTNPSITLHRGKPVVLVRMVNYTITSDGSYAIVGRDGSITRGNPIVTRNCLLELDVALKVNSSRELLLPEDWPETKYPLVRGLEDSRLFEWNGDLWTISNARELNSEGWCEQVLCQLTDYGYGQHWEKILLKERRHEKNWMPWVKDDELRFVYRLGTLIDETGTVTTEHKPWFEVDHISGGSQVIETIPYVYLAVVHEARPVPYHTSRYYQHRFVRFYRDGSVAGISPPFFFFDRQIEFAAGLIFDRDTSQLTVSFGVCDCEVWLATLGLHEVLEFIGSPK